LIKLLSSLIVIRSPNTRGGSDSIDREGLLHREKTAA